MDKISIIHECGKGHPHNTMEGKDRCDLKYADKKIKRIVDRGPPIYEKVVYDPPLLIDRGGIPVLVFQSAVRIA